MTDVRTRFAPSPTGDLHLGNVRIAAFNWLFARRHDGAFVLRIEDTDVERTREGSEEGIYRDLRWLGLDWDEGPDRGGAYGPYRQSERADRYRAAAADLLETEAAYRCYCTPEELAEERESVGGEREVLRYSGRCRDLTEEERRRFEEEGRTPSIRFASPREGGVEVTDEVRGSIRYPASDIDDFIVVRRDGRPTYNFAVVVDDAAMRITHVVRGAGHLSNTPKQALLFDALGEERPVFAHLPTVLSPEGGKLSKREEAAAVAELRERGYHPDAVLNYLSLLGWSSPDEEEVLTREELVEKIDLGRVGASDTVYDPEKLRWLSGRHIAAMSVEALSDAVWGYLDRQRHPLGREELERCVDVLQPRLTTFSEIDEKLDLLHPDPERLERARRELRERPEVRRLLQAAAERLEELSPWDPDGADDAVREAGREVGASGRDLFHPLRAALTGRERGPELGSAIWALGREEALRRLHAVFREIEV